MAMRAGAASAGPEIRVCDGQPQPMLWCFMQLLFSGAQVKNARSFSSQHEQSLISDNHHASTCCNMLFMMLQRDLDLEPELDSSLRTLPVKSSTVLPKPANQNPLCPSLQLTASKRTGEYGVFNALQLMVRGAGCHTPGN
jgi:hypothetical protein